MSIILSEEEYKIFIPRWIKEFTENIKKAWPNTVETQTIIECEVKKALDVSISVMEIYDYFSISYPGIMHQAVSGEDEEDKLLNIFEAVMKTICDDIK